MLLLLPFKGINPLTPNGPYRGRTAPLTPKRYILYIYSTNIGAECFTHGIDSLFFSSECSLFHNSNILFTFYIQDVLKFKKNNSGAKRLNITYSECVSVTLFIPHTMCVRLILFKTATCLPLQYFSTLSLNWPDFRKIVTRQNVCFSISETSL